MAKWEWTPKGVKVGEILYRPRKIQRQEILPISVEFEVLSDAYYLLKEAREAIRSGNVIYHDAARNVEDLCRQFRLALGKASMAAISVSSMFQPKGMMAGLSDPDRIALAQEILGKLVLSAPEGKG